MNENEKEPEYYKKLAYTQRQLDKLKPEQRTEQALFSILINAGVNPDPEKDRSLIFEFLNTAGIPIDLGKHPEQFVYDFSVCCNENRQKQQELADKKIIDGKVAEIKNLAESYEEKKETLSPDDWRSFTATLEEKTKALREITVQSYRKNYVAEIFKSYTKQDFKSDWKKTADDFETDYVFSNGERLTFPVGEVSMIAAPTGHGKTTFLINLLLEAARKYPDKKHVLFAFEGSDKTIQMKCLNTYCDIKFGSSNLKILKRYHKHGDAKLFNYGTLERYRAKSAEYWKLVEAGTITVFYCPYKTEELVTAINEISKAYGDSLGVILVDYIGAMTTENMNKEQRFIVKDIAVMLEKTAIENDLCIISTVQFNRKVDGVPSLNVRNIQDGADLERKAATIVALWNCEKDKQYKDGKLVDWIIPGTICLKLLKDRQMDTSHRVYVSFEGNTGKLYPERLQQNVEAANTVYNVQKDNRKSTSETNLFIEKFEGVIKQ